MKQSGNAAAEPVQLSGRIAFFTGAGISVGAGLPTYRGQGGIYEESDLEPPHARDLAPDRLAGLWARFGDRLTAATEVVPAAAHRHIARIEAEHAAPVAVVTQNVDGLHSAAGSSLVIELHGTLRTMRCLGPGHRIAIAEARWQDGLPWCPQCGQPCRPNVVLFGEALPAQAWADAERVMGEADTVVAVGTSAQVYPAASLIGADVLTANTRIWINPHTPPPDVGWAWLQGDADTQVARLVSA